MKKNFKKATALLLSAAMAAGMLVGCGSSDKGSTGGSTTGGSTTGGSNAGGSATGGAGIDLSQPVELTMYLLGDRTTDFDEVYGEINKILAEKLNTTVKVEFLSWGEHDTKYSMLFAGGEDFDLIFTASGWAHYESTVAMEGFYPLSEEFIQTYAPDIWEVVPEVAWSQARIDGEIYMVPNFQTEFTQEILAVRGDLMKKYGFDQINNWDELYDFCMACAADGQYVSQGGPWGQYYQTYGLTTINGFTNEMFLYHTMESGDLEVTYLLDWDGFADYCHQAKELADAGAWSSDVLNSTEERQDGLLNGRTATMTWNIGTCYTYASEANKNHSDWNVTLVDTVPNLDKKTGSFINNGVAINAASKNKERAMMVLNEFYTNPAINDLARFGIEGKHWRAIGDDQYEEIDESNFGVDGNCNWGWMNDTIRREPYVANRTPLDDTYDAMMESWRNNIKAEHPYDGFTFNRTPVETQMSAVEAVLGKYYNQLINGIVDDVDATIAAYAKDLETAGINAVRTELEKQLSEYLASK